MGGLSYNNISWDAAKESLSSATVSTIHVVTLGTVSREDISDFGTTLYDDISAESKRFFANTVAPIFKPIAGWLGFTDQTIYSTEVVILDAFPPKESNHKSYYEFSYLNGILAGRPLTNVLLDISLNNPTRSLTRYIDYGKDTYSNGLPEVGIGSLNYIEANYLVSMGTVVTNAGLTIVSTPTVTINIPTINDWIISELQKNLGYTNFIIISTVRYVYANYSIVYDGGGNITSYTAILLDDAGNNINVTDISPFIVDFYLKYSVLVDTGTYNYRYISYLRYGDAGDSDEHIDTYETNIVTTAVVDYTDVAPIAVIKSDFTYLDSDTGSAEYLENKELLSKLEIGIDEISDSIRENASHTNIRDVFCLLGVNLYSTEPVEKEYVYRFFYFLARVTPSSAKTAFDAYIDWIDAGKPVYSGVKTPAFTKQMYTIKEDKLSMLISYNYAYVETETNVVAEESDINTITLDFDIQADIDTDVYTDGTVMSSLILYRQLNLSKREKITIQGISLTHFILTTVGTIGFQTYPLTTYAGTDSDKSKWVIPFSNGYIDDLPLKHKEEILYNLPKIVIYASSSTYLEYYETSQFISLVGGVIQVVGFVLALPTGGTSLSWTTVLLQILINMTLRHLLMEYVINNDSLTVEEKAAIAAIASAFVSMGGSVLQDQEIILADILLESVGSYSKYGIKAVDYELNSLQEENLEATQLLDEKEEHLKKLMDGLVTSTIIDPSTIIERDDIPVIEPKEFLYKSLNTNIAEDSLSLASTFVTNQLKLPKFTDIQEL